MEEGASLSIVAAVRELSIEERPKVFDGCGARHFLVDIWGLAVVEWQILVKTFK